MKTPLVVASLNRDLPNFTGADCNGPGLFSGNFDSETGEIETVCNLVEIENPGFLVAHPSLPKIYVATEMHDWEEGLVSSIAIDKRNLDLTLVNMQSSRGNCTSHISIDQTGRFLFATNYDILPDTKTDAVSVIVFPIAGDGSLDSPVSSMRLEGRGPNAVRQDKAHAHCVRATPDNKFVVVADLGSDHVLTIPFDAETGLLDADGTQTCKLVPGSGPRHFIFGRDGSIIYVLNELSSTLTTLKIGANGALEVLGNLSSRRETAVGHNDASDLVITPDGKFIFAANRGDDSIGVFAVQEDGGVTLVAQYDCGGHWPRNLCLHPTGSHLLVSNQYSSNIAVFSVGRDGALSLLRSVTVDSPMCIIFGV
jgi:6-phosphogluconolactonase